MKSRDDLAIKYSISSPSRYDYEEAFKAGWNARNEEIEKLKIEISGIFLLKQLKDEEFSKLKKQIEVYEKALEFYADIFPMPLQVIAHKKEDKKFEKLSTDLLNQFHKVAREALAQFEKDK